MKYNFILTKDIVMTNPFDVTNVCGSTILQEYTSVELDKAMHFLDNLPNVVEVDNMQYYSYYEEYSVIVREYDDNGNLKEANIVETKHCSIDKLNVVINYYPNVDIRDITINGVKFDYDDKDYINSVKRLLDALQVVYTNQDIEDLIEGRLTEIDILEDGCKSNRYTLDCNFNYWR